MHRRTFIASSAAAFATPAIARAAEPHVLPGDDVFVTETWRELGSRTIGIVTNQSGVLSDGTTVVDAVRANPEIRVKALFAPEHGLRGDRDAGTYVPRTPIRAAGCRSTASTATRAIRARACSTASTCWCSTSKTSARGRTRTCRRSRT